MDVSPPEPPSRDTLARRLSRLVALARAADFWERLWRGVLPPLIVIGLFICVSWLGLWLAVPHWGRIAGVGAFAILLAVSSVGLWSLRLVDRPGALKRIDKHSGVAHRPASSLDDQLASAGRDPATDALWALHKRRAEAETAHLRAGSPSPRAVELDRFALRAGVLAALFACGIIAGPQRYARLAAAFDFGVSGTGAVGERLDAWIDPPPYTGRAPIVLTGNRVQSADGAPQRLAAPIGSTVVVRWSGDEPPAIETTGPLLQPPAPKPAADADEKDAKSEKPSPDPHETKLVLHGDAQLVLRQNGTSRGTFEITAIPDQPPTIALREVPKVNARGSLSLFYTTGDDYGVASAEATFSDPKIDGVPTGQKPLVAAPRIALSLPGVTHGIGDGETTADLSDSPWAGAQATMVLVAHDEGMNEGRSEPFSVTVPQKPFLNPLARALVEQRRILVLQPNKRATVADALDALMIEPEAFGGTAGQYLGLRFAADQLAQAHTNAELVAVADFLWGMAQQIENGDLSDAERALRQAEKEMRDAIERHAPEEEIQKLTQNLQAAMDKFLKELAEQQRKDQQEAQASPGGKSISPRDLQKLIERLKEQAKSGNAAEAKKALDELQDVLENLKAAKQSKPDPQQRAMTESLNQLDQMMRDQQDLRDETFKREQQGASADRQREEDGGNDDADMPPSSQGREQGQRSRGRANNNGRGQQGQGQQGQGQQGQGQQGQGQQGQGQQGSDGRSLGERQQALRKRLDDIQKRLKQAQQGERALGDASQEMKDAEDALREGDGANGQAVDAQGRALEALRKGAGKLAESLNKQGQQQGEQQGGQQGGDQAGQQEGSQAGPSGEQSSDTDPLGRPRGGNNTLNSNARFDPLGLSAAQRAQRVLEELRRRLSDPARSQEEIDYLERLLRSF